MRDTRAFVRLEMRAQLRFFIFHKIGHRIDIGLKFRHIDDQRARFDP